MADVTPLLFDCEAMADVTSLLFDCDSAGNGSEMISCEQYRETCETEVTSAYAGEVLQTHAGGIHTPNR